MEITFAKSMATESKHFPKNEHRLILVLPHWLLDQEARRLTDHDYPGVCIQCNSESSTDSRYAVYKASFRWRVLQLERPANWADLSMMSSIQDPDSCLPSFSFSEEVDPAKQSSGSIRCAAVELHVSTSSEASSPILLDMSKFH